MAKLLPFVARSTAAGLVLGLLAGCSPKGQGDCQTDATNVVNTYTVLGVWKKITGYNPARSDAELELDYDFLIVEPGTTACLTTVTNGASTASIFNGLYTTNLTSQMITFPNNTTAQYSFSGQCSDTQMTLNYSSGSSVETYALINKDATTGICNPQ